MEEQYTIPIFKSLAQVLSDLQSEPQFPHDSDYCKSASMGAGFNCYSWIEKKCVFPLVPNQGEEGRKVREFLGVGEFALGFGDYWRKGKRDNQDVEGEVVTE